MSTQLVHAPRVVEAGTLSGWEEQWDGLVETMPIPSPFLRSWWLVAVAGSDACFVLVVRGDTLIGGLALRVQRRAGLPIYRFCGAGTLCPDHLDVLAAEGCTADVSAALAAWARRPGARLFDLAGAAEVSSLVALLPRARAEQIDVAPFQPLQSTFADYLAARPRSLRKTVRRAQNRFAAADATVVQVDRSGLDGALSEFRRLHAARGDRAEFLAELAPLRAALHAGVEAGEAWVDVLQTPTQVLAVSVAFAVCGRVSLYQVARTTDRDFDNASAVLNLAVIERASAAGIGEVDLLRGSENYKHYYAAHTRTLLRVSAANGPIAAVAQRAVSTARRVRRTLGRLRARIGTQTRPALRRRWGVQRAFGLSLPGLRRRRKAE